MLTWYDFARVQDRALVDACVAAGIREWEMQILNLPYVGYACLLSPLFGDGREGEELMYYVCLVIGLFCVLD